MVAGLTQTIKQFQSKSSPGKFYTVKEDQAGVLYCDCPAWRFKKPNQETRSCKHTEQVLSVETPKTPNTTAVLQSTETIVTKSVPKTVVANPDFLVAPMLASSGTPADLAGDKQGFAVGKKFDGFREIMHIGTDGKVSLRSRSGADHSANVPHLTGKLVQGIADTILDGEGIAPSEKHGETKTIFGSLPDVAIEAQIRIGNAIYMAFDILKFKGQDLTKLPLKERVAYLALAVLHLNNVAGIAEIRQEELVTHQMAQYFLDYVSVGGEGVMLKDLNAPYELGLRSSAWIKIKKIGTWDTVITGFTPGNGKYSGLIGAVRYGFWCDGKVVEVGKSSGMTDADRVKFASNPNSFIGKVAEIEGQEIGANGAIRFPRFLRIRDDKVASECML